MKKFNTVEEREAFDSGVDYTKGYIAFCLRHYIYDFLKDGTNYFQKDLCDFILGKSYILPFLLSIYVNGIPPLINYIKRFLFCFQCISTISL